MQLIIDNTSSRPVYMQIIDQIKRDIALAKVRQEEKLPTVRQLASQLVINPNTIAKAYRQLEQEGIIMTRAGAGAFVAPLENRLNDAVREKIITDQMERTVVDAVHMQVERETLKGWFEKILDKFKM